jgi:phosphomannomutase
VEEGHAVELFDGARRAMVGRAHERHERVVERGDEFAEVAQRNRKEVHQLSSEIGVGLVEDFVARCAIHIAQPSTGNRSVCSDMVTQRTGHRVVARQPGPPAQVGEVSRPEVDGVEGDYERSRRLVVTHALPTEIFGDLFVFAQQGVRVSAEPIVVDVHIRGLCGYLSACRADPREHVGCHLGKARGMDAGDDLEKAVHAWLAHDPDPTTRAEIESLLAAHDLAALHARFDERLVFGTAGLRGELGGGPNRMNRLVVRMAAQALMRHLLDHGTRHPSIVIGFDARRNSRVFARDSAAVIASLGGHAIALDGPLPTPVLAFAVRRLAADAGVMVTASHNPRQDNGYKVYQADGAQVIPPVDSEIEQLMAHAQLPDIEIAPPASGGRVENYRNDIISEYLDAVLAGSLPDEGVSQLKVVYTPLHGVGRDTFARAAVRLGIAPIIVPSQANPDPSFPTVSFPNPEEPGALDAALALASERDADVVIANDPDADRLAVALPHNGTWRVLTGNEIGWLLASYRIKQTNGPRRLVVTTVVSSALLSKLAAKAGVRCEETLTGFKWVVRPAIEDPEAHFIFGYEEALGFAVNDIVRDKDGITAAIMFLEMMAALRAGGVSPFDRLDELAQQFGRHISRQLSIRFDGAGAHARMTERMQSLRSIPITELAGQPVVSIVDYLTHEGRQRSDILRFDLADGGRVMLRPSGTEPKLKVYIEVIDPPNDEVIDGLAEAVRVLLS